MIAYLVLGVALLIGFVLLAKWFAETEPRSVIRAILWALGVLGVIAGLALLWAGRYQLAWIGLPALIGLASRWRQIVNAIKAARGPAQGQTSQVETRFLNMTLEHDTGVMTGVVREGRFQGAHVEDLDLNELVELWRELRAEDAQSAAVLEAYLDKVHGDAWRDPAEGMGGDDAAGASRQGAPSGAGRMSAEEAWEILGLQPGASADDIRAAYRKLMQKLHPDHGGSNYFAAKLNQARRVLLGE